jgi:hypothetical protein
MGASSSLPLHETDVVSAVTALLSSPPDSAAWADARDRLLATYAGITDDEFDGLPLQVRRSLVAACVTVVVLPASKRGPGFRTEDVQVTPR